jgi:hypothetical protein
LAHCLPQLAVLAGYDLLSPLVLRAWGLLHLGYGRRSLRLVGMAAQY